MMDLSQALQMASRTDAGMVRSHNEDAVFSNAALGLAILADGMGGYDAGEVASGMATTLLGSELEKAFQKTAPHQLDATGKRYSHSVLEAEIARANTAIYQAAQSQPQYAGMKSDLNELAGVAVPHGGLAKRLYDVLPLRDARIQCHVLIDYEWRIMADR